MTAREAAVYAVCQITDKNKSVHRVVNETLDGMEAEARERALAKRLIEGTVERLMGIDYVLNAYSKTPVCKMKPYVRAVLRVGAYQLLYMDSIPASAACNEAVKFMKSHSMTGLSGFVNGVLRAISRTGRDTLKKGEEEPGAKGIEIKYSVPEWLYMQWVRDYGEETAEKIAEAQSDAQPLYFRVNLSKCSYEDCVKSLEAEGVKCSKPELSLPEGVDASALPVILAEAPEGLDKLTAFQKGWFVVQDVSSMLVGLCADIKGGEKILDMCAAPGGKTLHLCDLFAVKEKGGSLDSRDLSSEKTALIQENLDRCGFEKVNLAVADASVLNEAAIEKYDLVLADVPCSGTGVTGRKPDIKYNMTETIQAELIELQAAILENAVKYVQEGGRLIFSTCTLNRDENEAGMKLLEKAGLKKEIELQLVPGLHTGDGFFISKYIKN